MAYSHNERRLWVLNDESLYNSWKASKQALAIFIKHNAKAIDSYIRSKLGRSSNPGIIGVALTQAGKFLGFVDGKGKIRKGRVRRVKNPATYSITTSWGVAKDNVASYSEALRLARGISLSNSGIKIYVIDNATGKTKAIFKDERRVRK